MYGPYPYSMTMTDAITKSERIEARLTAEQKDMLSYAAAITGRSLTDFVLESAQASALRAIEERNLIRLTAENQRRFAEAILKPVEPNDALKAAYADYKANCVSHP